MGFLIPQLFFMTLEKKEKKNNTRLWDGSSAFYQGSIIIHILDALVPGGLCFLFWVN